MRCTITTSSPSSVGKRGRFARRSAPASRRPSSAARGGSNVFSVAMCAGPAFAIGNAETGSSSARRRASTSGNSGTYACRLMDAISVAAYRGSFVESVHLVHAVAVRDGAVIAEAGDGALLTSLRSSAKPFQALPLVRSRDDLDDADVAIASASHRAHAEQIEAVRRLLAKAPAREDELEVGLQEGRPA